VDKDKLSDSDVNKVQPHFLAEIPEIDDSDISFLLLDQFARDCDAHAAVSPSIVRLMIQ
jgi:hypothetical protein